MRKPGTVKSQKDKFVEAGRKFECDESEAAFDRALKKVAKAPIKPPTKTKARKRSQ